jgi:RimJ/RimL family protein N-acetyltransferase
MLLLPPDRYSYLEEKIKAVQLNNLFARAVIEKHVTGRIYVDSLNQPVTFYVLHPYGISLLFGDYKNAEFNKQFSAYALNLDRSRTTHEWLQTWPREWDPVLQELFGGLIIKNSENKESRSAGVIELNTRVNFRFNREKFLQMERRTLSDSDRIVATEKIHFEQMPGSVIPLRFWDSAEDFIQIGKGFTLLHKGEIASTAYSAFVHENMLEIGIETVEKYRGFGFAELTCKALIQYCLERDLIPVWSCRFENTASYKLAQKLGFEPSRMIPFYRLSN